MLAGGTGGRPVAFLLEVQNDAPSCPRAGFSSHEHMRIIGARPDFLSFLLLTRVAASFSPSSPSPSTRTMRLTKKAPQTAFLLAAAGVAAPALVAAQAMTTDKWTLSTDTFQRDSWQVQGFVANGFVV